MASFIQYSTLSRSQHGPISANALGHYASVKGSFREKRVLQTDVLDIVNSGLVSYPNQTIPYRLEIGSEILLSEVLRPIYSSVGMMNYEGEQLGSCTLISWNLGIIACHCIEELDVTKLSGVFGHFVDNQAQQTLAGRSYPVESVIEFDAELDYAIVRFIGAPGKDYSFVPIDTSAKAQDELALLHHPIGKPLKVSVSPIVNSPYYSYTLQVYHDSDYGSCGGAYIDPAGFFVAIHLGAERHQMEYNLVRLALPLREIIQKKPNGIIACIANKTLPQVRELFNFLPFTLRKFIDLENYIREQMQSYGYVIRSPIRNIPGIIIDSHQKKHLTGCPSQYNGARGSMFPEAVNNDDLVTIAEAIVRTLGLWSTFPENPSLPIPLITWNLDKAALGNPLYRKLTNPPGKNGRRVSPVTGIGIECGWESSRSSWEMHFYPITG